MSDTLPKGWKWVKLGEIVFINSKNLTPNYPYDEIYYLDTGSVAEGRLISSYKKFYLKEAPSRAKRIVNDGDIVYSLVRPIQRHYIIIKNPPDNLIVSTGFAVITADNNKADNRFIYYYLTLNEIVEYLDSIAEGSTTTYPSIVPDDLKNLIFPLPPLPEQKAIAEVLSSIDDKIDLLHRQNKTLEEMAMTLFRQWFIEPTKDGLPEGWEEVSLGEIIEISSGKSIEKGKLKEKGLYPVLGANGEIGRTDDWLYEGELIYTGRVGTLGNVFIVFRNEKVWLTDNTLVIKPNKNEYFYFVYFTLKNAKLDEYNSGSTQPLIRQSDIKKIEIFLPKINFLKDFEVISRNLFTKIQFDTSQIQTLDKLRDTLLPKLMSGELRVKV